MLIKQTVMLILFTVLSGICYMGVIQSALSPTLIAVMPIAIVCSWTKILKTLKEVFVCL